MSRLSVLAAVCAAGVLAGCGATTEPPTEGKGTSGECTPGDIAEAEPPRPIVVDIPVDDALAKMVPASVKADGKLVVAKVAGDVVGMDVDLGNAVGQVLGLEVEFVDASLDGILAGRYELGMSSLVATDEQAVDFVTYFEAGTSTMVRKCNPEGIETAGDLCGKTVGAVHGTAQLDQLTKPDGSVVKACAGKEPPQGQGFPAQADVDAALQAERIDAFLAATPVVDYTVKTTGNAFEKAGEDTGVAPYGIAVPKNAKGMKEAVQAAVQQLISDGNYDVIMAHRGLTGGIKESEIS